MCGITGIFSKSIELNQYYKAHSLIQHRGPDDEGFVCGFDNELKILSGDRTKGIHKKNRHIKEFNKKPEWILGHHRLSIIDLSEKGHQPMCDETGRYWMVYNGEVYNYIELREELKRIGYVFYSNTDGEVVLKSFIHWKEDCFNKFNGMWGIAIYDNLEKKLFLTRDRFGKKPLYYSLENNNFLFASESKYFQPLMSLTLNEQKAKEYLRYNVTDSTNETFFNEISQVNPGCYAIYNIKSGSISSEAYWHIDDIQVDKSKVYSEELKIFEYLFTDAIHLRMRSDVPVGTLLSGGLDSTSIVSNLFEENNISKIETFSAVFHEEKYSEKIYINKTLNKYQGIRPHFVYPVAESFLKKSDEIIKALDFPFRSLAVFSQNELYKTVKNNSMVKVVLNGQGSDELFGGYTTHYYSFFLSLINNANILKFIKELRILNKSRGFSFSSLFSTIVFLFIRDIFAKKDNNNLIYKIRNKYFTENWLYKEKIFYKDKFQNHLRKDLLFSPLPEYLRYEDRNSMAFSIETRLPFLDYRLVEWALSLPNEFKIDHGVNKKIVRDAVKKYVVPEILNRKDKMGFISPQEIWQKDQLKNYVDFAVKNIDFAFLNKKYLNDKYQLYLSGKDKDWSFWWRITCLYYWAKNFI